MPNFMIQYTITGQIIIACFKFLATKDVANNEKSFCCSDFAEMNVTSVSCSESHEILLHKQY